MPGSSGLPEACFNLSGRTAVVTGGVGLLGTRYCKALAGAGARVVVADLDEERCRKLAGELESENNAQALPAVVDLANEKSIKAWAKKIIDFCGCVDILVNNAAAYPQGFFDSLENYSLDVWNRVLSVNVTGIFLTVRELGPSMVARGRGSIINASSIYGLVGPDQRIYEGSFKESVGGAFYSPLVYATTKGAVISMTRYLAACWGPYGVRTNTLIPGGVGDGHNKTFAQKYSACVPLGRMAKAEDMVGAILFLASDASSYVNGQNIVVDGGLTAW